jgi:hypothetical protein
VLENSSFVQGNLQMSGGSLSIINSTVGKNLQISGTSNFSVGPAASIAGNLQIQDLPTNPGTNQVCGAIVEGNLSFQNSGTALQIGSGTGCAGNISGGNLTVQNNTASTTIDSNWVVGNLIDQNNTASTTIDSNWVGGNLIDQNNTATQVFTNGVTANLQCNGNSSITGGGNTATRKQGQCATY